MAEEEQQNTEATQAQEATPEVKEAPAAQDKQDRKSTRLNSITINLVCRLLLEKKKKNKNT